MYDNGKLAQINVYMPKELLAKIDNDRGNFSRSGYLVTMTEIYFDELSNYENNGYAPRD